MRYKRRTVYYIQLTMRRQSKSSKQMPVPAADGAGAGAAGAASANPPKVTIKTLLVNIAQEFQNSR